MSSISFFPPIGFALQSVQFFPVRCSSVSQFSSAKLLDPSKNTATQAIRLFEPHLSYQLA
jgi:hypothetical protein